ncbi:Uncharacterised protein [Mycobacteroides abscessus subsp. abscessus]|nr:Uncharacterised protein [Mycobacteroides abscessus subsp. abscessus]
MIVVSTRRARSGQPGVSQRLLVGDMHTYVLHHR